MKNVLVVGAAGYVGSELCKRLRNFGKDRFHIIGVDCGMFGVEHVKRYCDRFFHEKIKTVLNYVSQHYFKIDCVVFLGGLSNDPMADFSIEANTELNYKDVVRTVEFCFEKNIMNFVFASSASIYGDLEELLCREDGPINPHSNYAKSKRMAEEYILNMANEVKHFNPIIFRKGTISGVSERMRLDLIINTMVSNAIRFDKIELYGGGENWRPIVSLQNVVSAYTKVLVSSDEEFKKYRGQIFNIVQRNVRVSELGLRIKDMLGVSVKARYDMPRDIRSYRTCGEKFKDAFKFEYVDDLKDMILDVKSWVETNKKILDDPIFYNIRWLNNCKRVCETMGINFSLLKND